MTQSEFEARIGALLAQVATLKAIRDGKLVYCEVRVKGYKVAAYRVRSHVRRIAGQP